MKRRGPMTWLGARSRAFWVLVVVLLPVFYVLSSGPMRMLAFRQKVVYELYGTRFSPPTTIATANRATTIWVTVYRPLVLIGGQQYGEPLRWYWNLFPKPIDP